MFFFRYVFYDNFYFFLGFGSYAQPAVTQQQPTGYQHTVKDFFSTNLNTTSRPKLPEITSWRRGLSDLPTQVYQSLK